MLNSCTNYPVEIEDKEPFLSVDYTPDIETFSLDNPELHKIVKTQRELYSHILKVLVVCRESEDFNKEDLDSEIEYVNELISWFDSLLLQPSEE